MIAIFWGVPHRLRAGRWEPWPLMSADELETARANYRAIHGGRKCADARN